MLPEFAVDLHCGLRFADQAQLARGDRTRFIPLGHRATIARQRVDATVRFMDTKGEGVPRMPNARIEALKRWAQARQIRRRHVIIVGVLALILAVFSYVLRPSVQRQFALDKLGPLVENLAIEHVQITPWSAELRGVELGYGGGQYRVGRLALGFNPLSLVAHTLAIRHLQLTDTVIDVRKLAPSPPSTRPFAGVLAAMNHGYALKLATLEGQLTVLLAGDQKLDLTVGGSGFAPLRVGTLKLHAQYAPAGAQTPLHASGQVLVTQLNRGRVRLLEAKLEADVPLPSASSAQHLEALLEIEPPTEYAEARKEPRVVTAADGSRHSMPDPEALALRLRLGNASPARFEIAGRYRGEDGLFRGHYRLADIARLLETLAGGPPLPELHTDTHGQVELDSVKLRGNITLTSRTRVSALQRVLGATAALPDHIDVALATHGSFDTQQFTLDRMNLKLLDADSTARLEAAMGAPLTVSFATPLTILDTPRELARIALGPLPLAWLQGLAPGYTFNGELLGPYALAIDAQKRVRLETLAPSSLSNVRVAAIGATGDDTSAPAELTILVDSLSLATTLSASWSADFLRFNLLDTQIMIGPNKLANISLKAASRSSADAQRTWRVRTTATANYDALSAVPVAAARLQDYPLPAGLGLAVKGVLTQHAQAVSIEKAQLDVSAPDNPQMLNVVGLQPFHVTLGDTLTLNNAVGELATLATRGIDLAWLNPLLQGVVLSGRLASADFKLVAPSAGTLALTATAPVGIDALAVSRDGVEMLRGLTVRTTPDLRYSASDSRASLKGLSIRSGAANLISGELDVAAHHEADQAPQLATRGRLALDLSQIAAQPLVAGALAAPLPAMPLLATLDFDLGAQGEAVSVKRSHADLVIGERTRISLEASPGLVLKTQLAKGEDLAQYFVGAAALDIKDLSSQTLNRFVPLGPLSFAEINSSLRIRSDGKILRAVTLAPLGVDAARVNDGPHELLREFSLKTNASISLEGHEIRARLKDLALTFAAQPATAALSGYINAHLDPDKQVALTLLEAKLEADLPQLLAQPAVLPGHHLQSGTLAFEVAVDARRKITAKAVLDHLASDQALAIQTFELPVTGEMAEDGHGFSFTAPLIGRGKSGVSNATVNGQFAPQPDEVQVLNLDIASEVFYLNDILATAQAIKTGSAALASTPAATDDPAQPVKVAMNETPDTKAVWKVLPPAVVVNLQIDKLFYTDYLAFTDVGGKVDVRRRKLAFNGIKAHFHDSALRFDGLTRFDAQAAQPYNLDLSGTIKNFNLNQFFTELVPGEKPRVEGLFSIDVKAFGQFPNFSQLRNKALFDIRMQSRNGLFRPLPPDSGLLLGASDVLGVVGEGLSYVPTGGFGAGAIARLVNYIVRIDYDTIDIHLQRDESRDVTIEQFQLLSPTIALLASGGIKHQDGSDIFDSPLELNANLDMLGRGAAILYSMDLMRNTQNPLGYWRGPEFRIWGTPSQTHSNFEDVINKAADGTTKGAFLRPISGLIGNLKYRWFDRDSRKREALLSERQTQRLEQGGEGAAFSAGASASAVDVQATPAP